MENATNAKELHMFCKQCGNELADTDAYCDVCGEPTQAERGQGQIALAQRRAFGSDRQAGDGSDYRSFEYSRTTVKNDLAQVACDCYESLGYELTGQKALASSAQTTLSFRRSRKIRRKAQLAKVQRTMDDTLTTIVNLEAEKTHKATTQALVIGIVSALVLGVGMCCTMVWTHLMVLGVIVGIIGIAGCIFAWLRYRKISEAETARINPQIEDAFDRLATQCEEAQAILRASE